MAGALLVRDVRAMDGALTDVLVRDGRIAARGPAQEAMAAEVEVIEGGGRLLFPGFVDAHAHLDKTLYGLGWYRNEVGPSLLDKIEKA